jgi:hypothetical protein
MIRLLMHANRCRNNSKSIVKLAETHMNDLCHDTDNICLAPKESVPGYSREEIEGGIGFHRVMIGCKLLKSGVKHGIISSMTGSFLDQLDDRLDETHKKFTHLRGQD